MRAIAITFVLCMMVMPVQAGDWRETCGDLGELATTIMKNRQSGVSMSKMMDAIAGKDGGALPEKLIISAYDSPRYSTQRMQKRTVEEFRDEVYLGCVKAMRGGK